MARIASTYLAELRRRAKESRVYRKYQLLGLEIAAALRDERHKSLYIKLAKEYGGERLLGLAKDVAERRDVRKPGAYFMALIAELPRPPRPLRPPRAPRRAAPRKRSARSNGK